MPAKKGKVVQDAGANDPPKGACFLFAFSAGRCACLFAFCSATLFAF
jgi:hypothetical protein